MGRVPALFSHIADNSSYDTIQKCISKITEKGIHFPQTSGVPLFAAAEDLFDSFM